MARLETKFRDILNQEAVWPNGFMTACQDSTGDYLDRCVNCYRSWGSSQAKNESYTIWGNVNSEHNVFGVFPDSHDGYMSAAQIKCADCKFNYFSTRCQDVEYSLECYDCEHCFGCSNLRRKKFCILNKQYTEEEYWLLLDKIKCAMLEAQEYGQYLPTRFNYIPCDSSNGRTIMDDWEEGEREALGVPLYDHGLDGAFGDWEGKSFLSQVEIPDSIEGLEIAEFSKCIFADASFYNRPFRYHPMELDLYRQMKTPIPDNHFIERVWKLWEELDLDAYQEERCQSCQATIEFSKNRAYPKRKICCQGCYYKYLEKYG